MPLKYSITSSNKRIVPDFISLERSYAAFMFLHLKESSSCEKSYYEANSTYQRENGPEPNYLSA